jgi:hypothetical membrane protein
MLFNRFIRLSGICGIILPIYTIALLFVSVTQAVDFSWTENAISDLGRLEYGSIYFNIGLIFIGIFLLIFSVGMHLLLVEQRTGPTIFALSAIYLIGVGIYPLPLSEHIDISSLFFIAFPIGFVVFGIVNYQIEIPFLRKMGQAALFLLIIYAIAPVTLLFVNGIAIPEAMVIIPGFFWCMVLGFYMLAFKF